MKTLVLVLSARVRPYPALVKTIKETWASAHVEGVETLFYFGGRETVVLGDELTLNVPDGFADIGRKSIACFDWCLQNRDFDLVFRTNCSSYVDLRNLRRYVDENGRGNSFYAGLIGEGPDGLSFASGAGYFLSRDLADLVVRGRARWNHQLIDDVALGELLAAEGVFPESAPRLDVGNVHEVAEVDLSHYHFRCQTKTRGRRGDRDIMRALHRAFSRSRGMPERYQRPLARLLRR